MSLRVDSNQAHRELARDTTFIGVHTSDHRTHVLTSAGRLSRFVLDEIEASRVPHSQHLSVWYLTLTILTLIRLSKTLYRRGLAKRRNTSNHIDQCIVLTYMSV